MSDIADLEVSARQLAEMLGISDRRVRQLAEQGVVIRGSKARYRLAESVRSFVAETKTASHDEAAQLLIEARRQKLDREKLKSKISDGELVPLEAFSVFSEVMTRAAEKGAAGLDRHLFPIVRDMRAVNGAVNAFQAEFFAWLQVGATLALGGAKVGDAGEFFGTYSTPSDAQDALISKTRKPRKTESTDDDE